MELNIDDLSLKIKPRMGRMLVETYQEDKEKTLKEEYIKSGKMSADSKLVLPVIDPDANVAPIRIGRVLKMSVGCYGKAFAHNYGDDVAQDMQDIKVGTLVLFVPYSDCKIDRARKRALITDEQVLATIEE